MAHALRQAAREYFSNPATYLAGAAGFAMSAAITEIVEPRAGMLFGTPFIPIQRFTFYLLSGLGNSLAARIARAALSYFASIAVGLFITSYFGVTITLLEGTLLTAVAWILGVVFVILSQCIKSACCC